MIRVLIVEDSPVTSELIKEILNSDSELEVIGIVDNGKKAIDFVRHTTPDVITMDINMPVIGGIEAIKEIMEINPVPIVIVSTDWKTEDVNTTFKAMEIGAVGVAEKPWGDSEISLNQRARKLIKTIKAMSEIKVIRSRVKQKKIENSTVNELKNKLHQNIDLIAIGASTGGPPVLQTILSRLPEDFPIPILIVQHIAPGFLDGFIELLSNSCKIKIKIACQNEHIMPGNVYFAPDFFQMKVDQKSNIILVDDNFENSVKPSVSYLFRSVASSFGKNSIGVLLTGMGKDGAKELLALKEKGAVTIVQDKESSVVHGMPGEAINIGAADYILSPFEIAKVFESLSNKSYD